MLTNQMAVNGPFPPVGQIPGTATNDSAAAGKVGEIIQASASNGTATVTITIASPGVVTWTAHGLVLGSPVVFTTTGALPTGLTASTVYWVIPVDANSFQVATTAANAIAGTAINTSGTQSGTQTGTSQIPLTSATDADIAFLSLTAGDWDVQGTIYYLPGGATTFTILQASISAVSATRSNVLGAYNALNYAATALGTSQFTSLSTPVYRVSASATGTFFLDSRHTFATSTLAAGGFIRARRVR